MMILVIYDDNYDGNNRGDDIVRWLIILGNEQKLKGVGSNTKGR